MENELAACIKTGRHNSPYISSTALLNTGLPGIKAYRRIQLRKNCVSRANSQKRKGHTVAFVNNLNSLSVQIAMLPERWASSEPYSGIIYH